MFEQSTKVLSPDLKQEVESLFSLLGFPTFEGTFLDEEWCVWHCIIFAAELQRISTFFNEQRKQEESRGRMSFVFPFFDPVTLTWHVGRTLVYWQATWVLVFWTQKQSELLFG